MSDYSICKECEEDYDTEDLNDSMLCRLCACTHERVECPSHEGNFDCNPFCRLCEGNQEYCPICEETALCVDCRTPLVGDKWYYSHENEMGSRICPKCYGDTNDDSLAVRTK